jgi:hypothetical protein
MLFAVERYEESGAGLDPHAAFPVLPAALRLAAALYLPADEVVLALIEGPDADAVGAAVSAAGWRVDRISPAAWLSPLSPLAPLPAVSPVEEVVS